MVLLLAATADRTFRKGIKAFKKESGLQVRDSPFCSVLVCLVVFVLFRLTSDAEQTCACAVLGA